MVSPFEVGCLFDLLLAKFWKNASKILILLLLIQKPHVPVVSLVELEVNSYKDALNCFENIKLCCLLIGHFGLRN